MEVRWSERAADDIQRIYWHIRQEDPAAAHEVVTTVYEGCSSLQRFPHRGRMSRMPGRRELIFPSLPYIVVYRVKPYAVEISRIFHAAQDWP